jgi:hypothetical protein
VSLEPTSNTTEKGKVMSLKNIRYTSDGVLILQDADETKRYKCMACGYTSETALDGTGIVIPGRERDENADRLIASGVHPSSVEARAEQYLIGLCGHNGSVVSELDGDMWEEYVKAHEDENIIVSECCYAPCEQITEEPDGDVKTCSAFEYMIDSAPYDRCYVRPGSLVQFNEGQAKRTGRVLDRVYRNGVGEFMDGVYLRVLVLSEDMTHAYIRYVSLSDMTESRNTPSGAMVTFFLRSDLAANADMVDAMSRAGELSEGYVERAVEQHGFGK